MSEREMLELFQQQLRRMHANDWAQEPVHIGTVIEAMPELVSVQK